VIFQLTQHYGLFFPHSKEVELQHSLLYSSFTLPGERKGEGKEGGRKREEEEEGGGKICPHKFLYINVHINFIFNSSRLDTTQYPSTDGGIHSMCYIPTVEQYPTMKRNGS
jgi:hypothetical protein